jgi:hypothetical protein
MHEHHLLDRSLYLHKSMPIGATAHQAGTVRFGTDPAASALDVNCKAHDVDNPTWWTPASSQASELLTRH